MAKNRFCTKEVISLLIHRMSANFGKLQGETLELNEGLNILQAPNETGKSTWCAFLVAMLYGINSRERDKSGFIAEKNRYAPWQGGTMLGRLDCRADGAELSLLRATRRASSPMAEFRALYTGTGTLVPELTGENCGEKLLGISREVFERSAFIRQAGLPISQDAELERRIAALITSGEEGTSYSEAAETLKKQLNRRRHNKTGQLPALEGELRELEQKITHAEALARSCGESQQRVRELEERKAALSEELAHHQRWEALQKRQSLEGAETAAREAQARYEEIRRRAEQDRIPEMDAIGRLRGAIVNLGTVRRSVEKARQQRDEAAKALLRAEAAVSESPFAGQTAEQAVREAASSPAVHVSPWKEVAVFFAGLAAAGGAFMLLSSRISTLDGIWNYLPWGVSAGIVLAGALLARLVHRHEVSAARLSALVKRFGTSDPGAIAAMAEEYRTLVEQQETARVESERCSAAAEGLHASLTANEQAILLEIRRFAPTAFDLSTADELLRGCAQRRRELSTAEAALREAKMRLELLQGNSGGEENASLPQDLRPPLRRREVVEEALASLNTSLERERSAADQLSGELRSAGDPIVLRSAAGALRQKIAALEEEYAAIRLAMDTLDQANTDLQNRFSPALGRRVGEIFAGLTGGAYDAVVLDRALRLSAAPAGDSQYRDAGFLSVGTTDQLYLATRLAICEMVLPDEKQVPIVLDDALANFDDERCRRALNWLKEEAKHRQILLFTCHSREADFFAGDGEVFVQRLTNGAEKV